MKKLNCLLAATGAALLWVSPAPAAADSLLIENVTLLSPEQAQPLGGRHVLMRDGRIVEVSDRAITPPPGARRVNGAGKYLTPGLTDAHVHVSQAIGLPFTPEDPAIAAMSSAFFTQQPRSYLYFGVTQVLDPRSHDVARGAPGHGGRVLDAVREGEERDPHGNEADRHQDPSTRGRREARSPEAPPRHPQQGEVQDRERDPEPLDPLARGAAPPVGQRHCLIGRRREARRQERRQGGG